MKRVEHASRTLAGTLLACVLPCLAAACGSAAPDRPNRGGGGGPADIDPAPPAPDPGVDHDADLPDPDQFSSGSSTFWRALDNRAVHRYAAANERRIMAVRVKDTAAADAALRDYERYFGLHRQYHQRYIQAEALERMTALGVQIGTGMRP